MYSLFFLYKKTGGETLKMNMEIDYITPVEKIGDLFFKREDLYEFNGMYGSKVRACVSICKQAISNGFNTVTTLGAKGSPQINIASTVGQVLGLRVVGHTTTSPLQPDMLSAINKGAEIIQHPYGYTSVLIKRASDYAINNNAYLIPFGMDKESSVLLAKEQVKSIVPFKDEIKRIVVPMGSGINLSGIILGLKENDLDIPVVAIKVGHNPEKILKKYLGEDYKELFTEIEALQPYNKSSEYTEINGIEVDSIYEGKCIPFLQSGDLFWIIGKRETQINGKKMVI